MRIPVKRVLGAADEVEAGETVVRRPDGSAALVRLAVPGAVPVKGDGEWRALADIR